MFKRPFAPRPVARPSQRSHSPSLSQMNALPPPPRALTNITQRRIHPIFSAWELSLTPNPQEPASPATEPASPTTEPVSSTTENIQDWVLAAEEDRVKRDTASSIKLFQSPSLSPPATTALPAEHPSENRLDVCVYLNGRLVAAAGTTQYGAPAPFIPSTQSSFDAGNFHINISIHKKSGHSRTDTFGQPTTLGQGAPLV
ncbi:hypothetical protein PC9H_010287 [Pleurotus ostreatus]|uniref:Uncharacterized protein n=1 Tax=Pleurotus ostreatus TaxID=5322 RepID=A0A8H7DSW7_PLEOS|nr:uncharacterized protein PC9H_010287 [Pleurotus ostreatus]KAF7424976.1 hypothetical protein PC9H_010287 [Pleurotus ostreatus]